MNSRLGPRLVAAIGGVVALLAVPALAAEEQTIDAFPAWQARSHLYATGKNSAGATVALAGQLYVQTTEGPVYSGEMLCPGMMDVDLANGSQSGAGRCLITSKDGARVFARWTCKGTLLIGCEGAFTITGGTGRFDGVTGGGPMLVRSGAQDFKVDVGAGIIERTATGVTVWRGLKYKLP